MKKGFFATLILFISLGLVGHAQAICNVYLGIDHLSRGSLRSTLNQYNGFESQLHDCDAVGSDVGNFHQTIFFNTEEVVQRATAQGQRALPAIPNNRITLSSPLTVGNQFSQLSLAIGNASVAGTHQGRPWAVADGIAILDARTNALSQIFQCQGVNPAPITLRNLLILTNGISKTQFFAQPQHSCLVDGNNLVVCGDRYLQLPDGLYRCFLPGETDDDGDGFCEDANRDGQCDDGTQPNDCNDNPQTNGAVQFPGNTENCTDGIDNNCDGIVDNNDPTCPGFDTDGDGVPNNTDCCPNDAQRFPGNTEIPQDGIDQDCDRSTPARLVCDGSDGDVIFTVMPDFATTNAGTPATYQVSIQNVGGYAPPSVITFYGLPNTLVPNGNNFSMVSGQSRNVNLTPDLARSRAGLVPFHVQAKSVYYRPGRRPVRPQPGGGGGVRVNDPFAQIQLFARQEFTKDLERGIFVNVNNNRRDDDGDGFCEDLTGCDDGSRPGDCNDDRLRNGAIQFPGNPEVCDGIDNDCNSQIDENPRNGNLYYRDRDSDLFGDMNTLQAACTQPFQYVANPWDCNDGDAGVNPSMREICGNGKDDDCDGFTDCGGPMGDLDDDGDGFCDDTDRNGICDDRTRPGDCDDRNREIYPGHIEICGNRLDDDCDPATTDACTGGTPDIDDDRDGYCDDANGDGVCTDRTAPGDCDDTNDEINPGRVERCGNGIDDDCNARTSDDCSGGNPDRDDDGDGFCDDVNRDGQCDDATRPGDCNDSLASINPLAMEVCDNVDNDCDGISDEGCRGNPDRDDDGDGYCEGPTCSDGTRPGDCDDSNRNVNPGMAELCGDLLDNNCDMRTDETCIGPGDQDNDGDGYCEGIICRDGSRPGDCNDGNAAVNPGEVEDCDDGFDNNCDGLSDGLAPVCQAAVPPPTPQIPAPTGFTGVFEGGANTPSGCSLNPTAPRNLMFLLWIGMFIPIALVRYRS